MNVLPSIVKPFFCMSCRTLSAIFGLSALLGAACENSSPQNSPGNTANASTNINAAYGTPVIDGSGADTVWENTEWHLIDQPWQGPLILPSDFQGRYKVAWDENSLYFLVEIDDDTLSENTTANKEAPHLADALLLFLDEDASGGERINYNAFAYALSLDGHIVDGMPDSAWHVFDDHAWIRCIRRDNTHTWEIALRVYDGKQYRTEGENIPKRLKAGKKMGFAIAYGDRDGGPQWENIIGNLPLKGQDPETPWKNAGIYLTLNLLR